MSLLFRQFFACCLRSHTSSEGQPNERTPLNANSRVTQPPIQPDVIVSDRQKVKERLGNIVRSKEGKMVNVADHLPFNLHHRSAPGPSTSRLRTESPSPHPSIGTGETTTTSRSESSRRPLGSRFGLSKEPALNARLVRGRDGTHRRGFGRGRLERSGEERCLECVEDHSTDETAGSRGPKGIPKLLVSHLAAAPPEIGPLKHADRDRVLALSEEIGKQLRNGWNIGDAGPISRSWGD